ncbi:MAG: FAD-dependent oxidoreductase [Sphaerochaetaceae bacterium]|nr:FAD-dependent oxidoreductase [Sphaerochaetaceae bacterium]
MEQFDSIKVPCQGEANPNKRILKLGKKITDIADHMILGVKSSDPEYWGLKEMVTEEMLDITEHMKLRKFYYFEELQQMNPKYDKENLERVLDEASRVGLIEYDYSDQYNDDGPIEGADKRKRWRLSYFVPGIAELFNSTEKMIEEHPVNATFFERMTFVPLTKITAMVRPGGNGIGMHVIPVEKAIETERQSVKQEHISHWLQKYNGHLSAGICSCRASRAALGEGCGDDCNDWCIQVGDMADYTVETGRAHYITKEKALEILQKAEDNGYVHQITNIDGEDHIFDICNCNVKICNALRTSMLFNTPNMSRSAYVAKVDPQNCVACGRCVESCPAGAVKLGQKLCKKDGTEVQYPKAILPDKIHWGRYAWDENYRDTARLHNSYSTGSSPCKAACPAHVPVQGYLKMAHEGRYTEALALIKRENPFPAVCGRICNKRCEEACTRGDIDKAVSIDAVKKFLADREIAAENRYVPKKVVPSVSGKMNEKIAIIGAGPAGLSAAYYLAVMGYSPVVYEKNARPGGMMTYGIPTYKLEKDVIDAEIDVLKTLGVEIKCGVEVGKDITISDLKKQGFKAFYVAIGCQGGKRPGVPNDTVEGTDIAVSYLRNAFEHQDEKFTGNVVVVGGGNVAVDCAMTARRLGAAKVSMVCLEDRETMPASKNEVAEVLEEGIELCNSWGPKELVLDENGKLSQIVFKCCTRTIDPETGKFSPLYDESKTMTVPADKVVFAIGQAIEWGKLLEGTGVKFWHGNYPVADKLTYQTDDPDIFVGGDVYTGPRFVIDAIAQGHEAAESLHRHVRPHAHMVIGRDRRDFKPLDKTDLTYPTYDEAGRQEAGMDESIDWHNSFKDAHKTLTEEQVHIETGRCLGCGASVVDQNKCIGCGICTTRCEFDAIHLHRDLPECSNLRRAEDKITGLASYAIKRGFKIIGNSMSKEACEMRAKRKAYKKKLKETGDPNKLTGNAYTEE